MKRNHILMANFSKFCNYQTCGLFELHNLSKYQWADRIFKLWKSCVYGYCYVEYATFEILFNFSNFKTNFIEKFIKNFQVSKYILKVLINLTASPISMIWNFSTMKQQPFEFFLKFVEKSISLLKFSQMREILKPQFCWYF